MFRRVGWFAAAVVSLLCMPMLAFGLVGTSIAQAAAPAWAISGSAYPTNFAPGAVGDEQNGPGLLVTAVNVGGLATAGEFAISIAIPEGVSRSPEEFAFGRYGPADAGGELSCGIAGRGVRCSGSGPLAAGGSAVVYLPLAVEPGALGAGTATATIEGGGAAVAVASIDIEISPAPAPFALLNGEAGAFAAAVDEDGGPVTQAGSTPYQLLLRTGLSNFDPGGDEPLRVAEGGPKSIVADLPPGLGIDPLAVPGCRESQLEDDDCPLASQVGVMMLHLSLARAAPTVSVVPVFNMVSPPGVPAELGVEATEGVVTHLIGRMRSGDFGFSAEARLISAKLGYLGNELLLWGDPSGAGHDAQRGPCLEMGGICSTERLDTAFLRLPTRCDKQSEIAFRATSWNDPTSSVERRVPTADLNGAPVGIDGCSAIDFEVEMKARPTTSIADSPSGLSFELHVPQEAHATGLATAALKGAEVALPTGLTANVSAAGALGSCAAGEAIRVSCPESAKLGIVELHTPLVGHPLIGGIYLARPYENPFGSLLAIYLSVDDPLSGISFTLAGTVSADASSGRLTVTFDDGPRVPIEDLKLNLFDGPQAALTTPFACGRHEVTAALTTWSSPLGPGSFLTDEFATVSGVGGCHSEEVQAPNAPSFSAGTTLAEAGRRSPLVMTIGRDDGSQRLRSFEAEFPAGLVAALAGVETCRDNSIPRCPGASRVGSLEVRAGAGAAPLRLGGTAYLAGSYRRAPFSLVLVTPAAAGPFDLGEIAVRVALYVDPRTGRIRAVSDRLPEILEGIPLDLRSLQLTIDRPGFVLNPTSCDPTTINATTTSLAGQVADLASRFQVGNCARLSFRPRLGLRLAGPTHRGAHPGLKAVLRPRPGEANLRRAMLILPRGQLLDSRHIRGICSRERFALGTCPYGSVYGSAMVWSPLLDRPLSGPVYLRSSTSRLPELAASLDGEVHAELAARLDARDGQIRVGFRQLPDVPLSKVSINLFGGKRGLLVNSGGVCQESRRARVGISAQNGKVATLRPRVNARCG